MVVESRLMRPEAQQRIAGDTPASTAFAADTAATTANRQAKSRSPSKTLLQTIPPVHDRKTMNYNLATILAVIAILFVLLTYITGAPLVPVAVILLGLAIIFGGSGFRRV
jgi:type IV secretory pathway VirB2 component (pilin)